jgi:hypothetical protein
MSSFSLTSTTRCSTMIVSRKSFVSISGSRSGSACQRYWAIFEELWKELGYADYLGALQRYRLEALDDPQILCMANWLLDYPFADLPYPGAFENVRHARHVWMAPLVKGFPCRFANVSGAVMSSACSRGKDRSAGPDVSSAIALCHFQLAAACTSADAHSGFRAFRWFTSLVSHPRS